MSYVDEHGEVHDDPEETASDNRSKGGFKLDLIETVNADPKMKPRHLALIVAYLGVMRWPKRRAWLSTSRARAMTGLAESQISPCRRELLARGYLKPDGNYRGASAFVVNNPRLEDMRQHVAQMTEWLREQQAERQAKRRHFQNVTPYAGETEDPMSHQESGGMSHHIQVAISPHNTPHRQALNEEVSYRAVDDDPHEPFPAPESEEDAVAMLSALFDGCNPPHGVLIYFRKALLAGTLTPAEVDRQRRLARDAA